jgi:hypothetical protein
VQSDDYRNKKRIRCGFALGNLVFFTIIMRMKKESEFKKVGKQSNTSDKGGAVSGVRLS